MFDFFAPAGYKEAVGILNLKQISVSVIAFMAVIFALKATKRYANNIRRIIRVLTVTLWVLEIIKISLVIYNGNAGINQTVPLYYCSIVLYAGLLSSFCRGRLRRIGDVFLSCGGVVGGVIFLALPASSFSEYPLFHFITLQSLFLHCSMIFMGLSLVLSGNITLKKRDILYYLPLVGAVCLTAFIINSIYGSNLMFISQNYPSTPIEILYNLFPGLGFTLITVAGQLFLPFYAMYYLYDAIKRSKFLARFAIFEDFFNKGY